MALVSILGRAIQVEVEAPPETPEDSQYEPCYRCSFCGPHTKMTVGDWKTYALCEPCAVEATLAGEDVHSADGSNCPVCDKFKAEWER